MSDLSDVFRALPANMTLCHRSVVADNGTMVGGPLRALVGRFIATFELRHCDERGVVSAAVGIDGASIENSPALQFVGIEIDEHTFIKPDALTFKFPHRVLLEVGEIRRQFVDRDCADARIIAFIGPRDGNHFQGSILSLAQGNVGVAEAGRSCEGLPGGGRA